MQLLLSTIGYAAVATVIAALLGVGYLWQSERLTDEKLFRIVAMVHGVQVGSAIDGDTPDEEADRETPPEEPSLVEAERLREIAMRNHEARAAALQRGKAELDHMLTQLTEQSDRFDELATEFKDRLEQESAETAEQGIANVVRDLKQASPDKGKELLLLMLDRGGSDPEAKQAAMDDVIRLINRMPADTWAEILNQFEGADELERLHQIQLQQLEGGPKQRLLEDAMRTINDRDFAP